MRRSLRVHSKFLFALLSGIILFIPAYIWIPVFAGDASQPKVAGYFAVAPSTELAQSKTNIDLSELLTQTNQERASVGVGPLSPDQNLYLSANAKCNDMVLNHYWGHYSPSGQSGLSFIESIYPKYAKISENLAAGFNNSTEVVAGWMQSPSHKKALLDSSYQYVGFSVCEGDIGDGNGSSLAVVQHFMAVR